MSIITGTLYTFLEKGYLSEGPFHFIFQPAEAKENLAFTLVEEGIAGDVDYLYK